MYVRPQTRNRRRAPISHPKGKYIVEGAIEATPYDESLAREAARENCLVILPDNLKRNAIMLAMAEQLVGAKKTILVLARTREMVSRHLYHLGKDIALDNMTEVTGKDPPRRRSRRWNADIVCATPDILLGDLKQGRVRPDHFGLVVIHDAHWAVGNHAYSSVARKLASDTRFLAVTAALPSNAGRAAEVLERLRITRVVGRAAYSPDVVPYRKKLAAECVAVDLPPEMAALRADLMRALSGRCDTLRRFGDLENPSLGLLKGIWQATKGSSLEVAARDACRIRHALDILEVYGLAPLLSLCERVRDRPGADALLGGDLLIAKALRGAQKARVRGPDHPKLPKMTEMLKEAAGGALVVAGRPDAVPAILRHLEAAGIPSASLPHDAGVVGARHMDRAETIGEYRAGKCRVLVAVKVDDAFAGMPDDYLGPGEVSLVVCYAGDPGTVQSALDAGVGRLVALVTKGSAEDPDKWAADQMDWKMAQTLEENRRKAQAGCSVDRPKSAKAAGGKDPVAGALAPPAYKMGRHQGKCVVWGPAGAEATFRDLIRASGTTVRVLLGRDLGRIDGMSVYVVHDHRQAADDAKSRRKATRGEKSAAYRLFDALDQPGRNAGDIPAKGYRSLLRGRITVGDLHAIKRALDGELERTKRPDNQAMRKLKRMIHIGKVGQNGRRLSLYITADGRLYNGPVDMECKEGHRKILDYKLMHEIYATIPEYVESTVGVVMGATGGKLAFVD